MHGLNLQFLSPHRQLREFHVLSLIHEDAAISQHRLAESVGLSSAMVNNYIKEFISSGLVVARGANNRSIRYYLTDKGRDMMQDRRRRYLEEIFDLYESAYDEVARRFEKLASEGVRRLVLSGFPQSSRRVVAAAAARLGLEIAHEPDEGAADFGPDLDHTCDALVVWRKTQAGVDLLSGGTGSLPVRCEFIFS